MGKHASLVASIAFILFAIGCIVVSWQLPLGTPLEPMTGFVPLAVSLLLLVVSAIHLIQAVRGHLGPVDAVGELWKRPALVVAGLLLYSLVLDPLGYILATTALALLVMRIFEADAWLKPLAVALAASLLSYALFDRLLDVRLPPGILERVL